MSNLEVLLGSGYSMRSREEKERRDFHTEGTEAWPIENSINAGAGSSVRESCSTAGEDGLADGAWEAGNVSFHDAELGGGSRGRGADAVRA